MGLSENIGCMPNYTHLIGIMISKTIGFRGTRHFQTHPHKFTELEQFAFWAWKIFVRFHSKNGWRNSTAPFGHHLGSLPASKQIESGWEMMGSSPNIWRCFLGYLMFLSHKPTHGYFKSRFIGHWVCDRFPSVALSIPQESYGLSEIESWNPPAVIHQFEAHWFVP